MDKPIVKVVKLSEIKSHTRNPNAHNEYGTHLTDESIRQHGFIDPGTLDKNGVILHGNNRTDLASGQGADEAYVIEFPKRDIRPIFTQFNDLDADTDEGQTVAYRLNQTGVKGVTWDLDILAEDMDAGLDFDGVFQDFELDEMMEGFDVDGGGVEGEDTEPQIDRADELRQEWGVETGQLWQLGEHRLICGDCTDKDVVDRVMGSDKAEMMFADPPYNLASDSKNIAAGADCASYGKLKDSEWDKNFNPNSFLDLFPDYLSDNSSVYICTSHFLIGKILDFLMNWADTTNYIVWCKRNPMPSLTKRHYAWATELIAYGTKGKHIFNYPNEGHLLNWWDVVSLSHTTDHPTEKVIEIPERAIRNSSHKDSIVYDPFVGSGTTLIACHNLNRKCRAIEKDPGYCGVVLQRFFEHTGIKPVIV